MCMLPAGVDQGTAQPISKCPFQGLLRAMALASLCSLQVFCCGRWPRAWCWGLLSASEVCHVPSARGCDAICGENVHQLNFVQA